MEPATRRLRLIPNLNNDQSIIDLINPGHTVIGSPRISCRDDPIFCNLIDFCRCFYPIHVTLISCDTESYITYRGSIGSLMAVNRGMFHCTFRHRNRLFDNRLSWSVSSAKTLALEDLNTRDVIRLTEANHIIMKPKFERLSLRFCIDQVLIDQVLAMSDNELYVMLWWSFSILFKNPLWAAQITTLVLPYLNDLRIYQFAFRLIGGYCLEDGNQEIGVLSKVVNLRADTSGSFSARLRAWFNLWLQFRNHHSYLVASNKSMLTLNRMHIPANWMTRLCNECGHRIETPSPPCDFGERCRGVFGVCYTCVLKLVASTSREDPYLHPHCSALDKFGCLK